MDRIHRFKKEMIDLYTEVDLNLLLEKITAGIRGYLACAEASIFIYDDEKEELSFQTATGSGARELKRITLKKGQGIAGWIAEKLQGVIIDDCRSDPRHAIQVDQKTNFQTRSLLGTPVLMGNRLLGVLEAVNKKNGRFSQADLRLLGKMASFLAIPLQNAVFIRQMLEKEKIAKEVQIARNIQQSFLRQSPASFPGLDIAFLNIPSSKVGGDYYEIMPLNDREIVFSINDVAGHGIPASLLMAVFHSSFVYRLRRCTDITEIISHLNRLIAETTDANLYVTSFTCKIDAGSGELEYVNAGHPPPLVVRGSDILFLEAGGLAVGMFATSTYVPAHFRLQKGDVLILYTDGIVEAEDEKDEEFTCARLAAAAAARRELPAAALQAALIENLKGFCQKSDFADDITLMVIKFPGR
jgi:sigma-B regulation protein RsbU (phosphoserine phosphatase)